MSQQASPGLLDVLGRLPVIRRRRAGQFFTAAEVRHALREPASSPRARLVHESAARLAILLNDAQAQRSFRGLEDYQQRMPRILTLYCRGWEPTAIASDLSLFSTAVGVEEAIQRTAEVIASDLNTRSAA